MKIVLIGARLSKNFGGPALFLTTLDLIRKAFPDCTVTFLAPYKTADEDRRLFHDDKVEIVSYPLKPWLLPLAWLARLFGVYIGPADAQKTLCSIKVCDAMIDIWGIMFADTLHQNTFAFRLSEGLHFYIAKLFGKRTIKYTAALGPFAHRWNRFFARCYLGRYVDFILARDRDSRDHVASLGIRTPIEVAPDTAFLLSTASCDATSALQPIGKSRPIIGLSVSYQVRNRAEDTESYFETMQQFVRHLIATYGAHVVILPNELSKGELDDLKISQEIARRVQDKNCRVIDPSGFNAMELKGVIAQCEAVVAARYHTIVASLSLGIPTLAIGWHHKYQGVLNLFHQEKYLCPVESLTLDTLTQLFADLMGQRETVRATLRECMADVKKEILLAAQKAFQTLQA